MSYVRMPVLSYATNIECFDELGEYFACCRSMASIIKDFSTLRSTKRFIEPTWSSGAKRNAARTTAISVGWLHPDQVRKSRYGSSAMLDGVPMSSILRKTIDAMWSKFVLWQRKRQDDCEAGFSRQASVCTMQNLILLSFCYRGREGCNKLCRIVIYTVGQKSHHIIMPLPVIRHRRHSVFGLYVSVCDHMLKFCEHDILLTACGNFTRCTT